MIKFNLSLLRVKLQKEGKCTLWEHIESCLFRNKAVEYHLSAIEKKLEEVKDWTTHDNKMFNVFEIEWEIGYEVDALMLTLHSLIDITALVIGNAMNYELTTNDYWDELKEKGIPDKFSSLIQTYRGNHKWKTIIKYSNVTKHVKNISGTLHLDYMEEEIKTKFKTKSVKGWQLHVLDVASFKELISFIEEFVKDILKLIVMHLWPNSIEDFNAASWSISRKF
jgi:hypothetical protein